jgi:hypothetical protein
LKPAKPVPDGKKVKCPKCGGTFTSPGLVEEAVGIIDIVEEADRPRKAKKPGRKEKAGIKKAREDRPAPKKKKKSPADSDEESGGIYSPITDPNADDEKPDIEYAPDLSIKDLRGPAQEAVVKPSNYLLLLNGLGCVCNIFLICVMFWPMVFSESSVDYYTVLEKYYKGQGGKDAENKIKGIPKERKDLKDQEKAVVEEEEEKDHVWRFEMMGLFLFLLIYNAVAIIGAVKMQNLESRGWGIASSIMNVLPFSAAGIGALIGGLFYKTLGSWLLDELAEPYAWGLAAIAYLVTLCVGVWALRTLMEKKVIDGFHYVAD